MKVLVCGGRHWYNKALAKATLDAIHAETPITLIIEGGALGADRLGRYWAGSNSIRYKTEEANWYPNGDGPTGKLDRSAGPKRNSKMLEYEPDLVVAFYSKNGLGTGTADMMKKARKAGIKVMEVTD